jgi:hypothetical protein
MRRLTRRMAAGFLSEMTEILTISFFYLRGVRRVLQFSARYSAY